MIDDLVKGMNGNHWAEIFPSFIILSDNRYMILEQTRLIWKINRLKGKTIYLTW